MAERQMGGADFNPGRPVRSLETGCVVSHGGPDRGSSPRGRSKSPAPSYMSTLLVHAQHHQHID